MSASRDSFSTRRTLEVGERRFDYFSLEALSLQHPEVARLPMSLKILLENLLRFEEGSSVTPEDILALLRRDESREIAFRPARVLMQDFTGVPAIVDLAAMRDAVKRAGGDPESINPQVPVDLVIDHSVQVDRYGSSDAFEANVSKEMERNGERYAFLRWGQNAFANLKVVPPGTGICHQVNLEYLARVVWTGEGEVPMAYPDTLVGTDSHTTMINGLGVLGWGVGGIEAEAAMLGQPVSMLIPEVVGVRLQGALRAGVTATDLVLRVTELLRQTGVVGKFVEFFGPGLSALALADRATIANMAPEYGATCGFFAVDAETIAYLRFSGRPDDVCDLVEQYAKAQGLWRQQDTPESEFSQVLELDLDQIVPSLAGPKRPQDRVTLPEVAEAAATTWPPQEAHKRMPVAGEDWGLGHGDLVIAAITSCTNTSNPGVMLAAGLLAKKARAKGLRTRAWVKTSLAPGSKVVMDYLDAAGLTTPLEELGFNLVGFGCTTCIGNSGPLDAPIAEAVKAGDLSVAAVLSGNRNFEGRIHPQVRGNWLASPPLVVAYALAGTTRIDLSKDPLGTDEQGQPVFLRDLWPSPQEIAEQVRAIAPETYREGYRDLYQGTKQWQELPLRDESVYPWDDSSTYVKEPPFFRAGQLCPPAMDGASGARVLALLGDSITTDHISPAGSIAQESPAGRYLQQQGVSPSDFNSYGSRRGNHEVMMRGTFANIRIRNRMVPGVEGGLTRHIPSGEQLSIFDAAMRYQKENTPLVIIAGQEYGTGSSRDWAAKGTLLLGVRAVVAQSFERIHRSNLIGMGVLPLQFESGQSAEILGLTGEEFIELIPPATGVEPGSRWTLVATRGDQEIKATLTCRLDTGNEVSYFKAGGILPYVLQSLAGRPRVAGRKVF